MGPLDMLVPAPGPNGELHDGADWPALELEELFARPLRAIAFDVDAASLTSLQEALPGWSVEIVIGGIINCVSRDWSPDSAALFVIGVHNNVTETLGLCRFLAFRTSFSADAPN